MMERLHDLTHAALRIDYPHDHWWMALLALLLFGIVPAWSAWHLVRWIWRLLAPRKILGQKALPSPNLRSDTSLERFALSFARGLQVWLVFVSALTVPITWLMLVSGVLFLSCGLEGGCGRIGPGQELVEAALGMAVDDAADHVG